MNWFQACAVRSVAVGVLAMFGAAAAIAQTADSAPIESKAVDPVFVTVNGKAITQKEFHTAFASHLRQKYYHGQVPEGQLAEARKDVADRLIERVLVLGEANKRGIVADQAKIAKAIAGYDAQYANSEVWKKNRETMIPGLTAQLAEQDVLQQIEAIVRTPTEPTDEAVRAFYKAKPELFTEPEKLRLHTILLKIDPSAARVAWDAAREEAQRIVARIRSKADDFSELARLHSNDSSAEKGGDMGYIHRGMIPDQVQAQIEKQKMGEVTDPLDVLEGVAIFRLDEIVTSQLRDFDSVAPRAKELLKREMSEAAWVKFIADLRAGADVKFAAAPAPAPVTVAK
ncbi:MAG TPA: peptidylprolyl isomerase [Rhodocyclaceae bacterium]